MDRKSQTHSRTSMGLGWLVVVALSLLALLHFRIIPPLDTSLRARHSAGFDADEMQHMHSAWYLAQGQVPYKDYFEHHTPLLYFQLAPLMAWIQPEQSFEQAKSAMLAGRTLAWGWIICILVGVVLLGYLWRRGVQGLVTGLSAACFLCSVPRFWDKVMEIRPDAPAVALLVFGVCSFLYGLRIRNDTELVNPQVRRRIMAACFVGGSLVALSLLHTQKVLFIGPGLALFWFWYCVDSRWEGTPSGRLQRAGIATSGFLFPVLCVITWFVAQNAFSEFIWFNLGFNFGWKAHFSPIPSLATMLEESFLYVQLGLLGIVARSATCWQKDRMEHGDPLLLAVTLGGLVGLFLIPEPYFQYHQLFLPFLALFAADALVALVFAGVHHSSELAMKMRRQADDLQYLVTQGPRYGRLCVVVATVVSVVLTLLVTPLDATYREQTRYSSAEQWAILQWVMENTDEDDVIVNGWPLYGQFRPHAWFYWSHQHQMFDMVPSDDKSAFVDDIVNERIRPKLIADAEFLDRLPAEFNEYVDQHYVSIPGPRAGRYRVRRETQLPE